MYKFILLSSSVSCLHARTSVVRHVLTYPFFFSRTAVEDEETNGESKFSSYLLFITILYHMDPYSLEKRPDADEHSKLSELCLPTTN